MTPKPEDLPPEPMGDRTESLAKMAEQVAHGLRSDAAVGHSRLSDLGDPHLMECVQEIERETQIMTSAANKLNSDVDFERAFLAINERAKLHRSASLWMVVLLLVAVIISIIMGILLKWHWTKHFGIVSLPGVPVLLWCAWVWWRRRGEIKILQAAKDGTMESLFNQSTRIVMNEFQIVRASLLFFLAGLMILTISSLFGGQWILAAFEGVLLVLVGRFGFKRLFGQRAHQRAEQFATGYLSFDDFASGHDDN